MTCENILHFLPDIRRTIEVAPRLTVLRNERNSAGGGYESGTTGFSMRRHRQP
jgi:hypothetical protein